MRVYIKSSINLPKPLLPIVEEVTFADGKAWEFCDVEKMEYNEYNKYFVIFFVLNGRTTEVGLRGMSIADVIAVYPN